MDLIWILGGTWLFWRLVGKRVSDWAEGFRGVRVIGRHEAPRESSEPAPDEQPRRSRPSGWVELEWRARRDEA